MDKKQIIDKIINDLPTCDVRGEMSPNEWYEYFEEAFDKGYADALRISDVSGSLPSKGHCFECNDELNKEELFCSYCRRQ
jgi:hypothetical protein